MIVNGENIKLSVLEKPDIDSLLKYFKLSSVRVAIEWNGHIIKKNTFKDIILNEQDVIEIIHFVGGGK